MFGWKSKLADLSERVEAHRVSIETDLAAAIESKKQAEGKAERLEAHAETLKLRLKDRDENVAGLEEQIAQVQQESAAAAAKSIERFEEFRKKVAAEIDGVIAKIPFGFQITVADDGAGPRFQTLAASVACFAAIQDSVPLAARERLKDLLRFLGVDPSPTGLDLIGTLRERVESLQVERDQLATLVDEHKRAIFQAGDAFADYDRRIQDIVDSLPDKPVAPDKLGAIAWQLKGLVEQRDKLLAIERNLQSKLNDLHQLASISLHGQSLPEGQTLQSLAEELIRLGSMNRQDGAAEILREIPQEYRAQIPQCAAMPLGILKASVGKMIATIKAFEAEDERNRALLGFEDRRYEDAHGKPFTPLPSEDADAYIQFEADVRRAVRMPDDEYTRADVVDCLKATFSPAVAKVDVKGHSEKEFVEGSDAAYNDVPRIANPYAGKGPEKLKESAAWLAGWDHRKGVNRGFTPVSMTPKKLIEKAAAEDAADDAEFDRVKAGGFVLPPEMKQSFDEFIRHGVAQIPLPINSRCEIRDAADDPRVPPIPSTYRERMKFLEETVASLRAALVEKSRDFEVLFAECAVLRELFQPARKRFVDGGREFLAIQIPIRIAIQQEIDEIMSELERHKAKGFTLEHDQRHEHGELAECAALILAGAGKTDGDSHWPVRLAAKVVGKYSWRDRLKVAASLLVAEMRRTRGDADGWTSPPEGYFENVGFAAVRLRSGLLEMVEWLVSAGYWPGEPVRAACETLRATPGSDPEIVARIDKLPTI